MMNEIQKLSDKRKEARKTQKLLTLMMAAV